MYVLVSKVSSREKATLSYYYSTQAATATKQQQHRQGRSGNLMDDGKRVQESDRHIIKSTCLSDYGVISVVKLMLLILHC